MHDLPDAEADNHSASSRKPRAAATRIATATRGIVTAVSVVAYFAMLDGTSIAVAVLAGLIVGRWWMLAIPAFFVPLLVVGALAYGEQDGDSWTFLLNLLVLLVIYQAIGVLIHRVFAALVYRDRALPVVVLHSPPPSHAAGSSAELHDEQDSDWPDDVDVSELDAVSRRALRKRRQG